MSFSEYLNGKREICRGLIAELGRTFSYVSILGTDVHATIYRTDRRSSAIRDGEGECGFVIKMHNGKAFFEYSLDDLSGDIPALAEKIRRAVAISPSLEDRMIESNAVKDEPLRRDFIRETDFASYGDSDILS